MKRTPLKRTTKLKRTPFKKTTPLKRTTGLSRNLVKKLKSRSNVPNRPTEKQLDALWGLCIKTRAHERSEYSFKDRSQGHQLHPHHILGKANHSLRWDLDNGVCLTGGEHGFIAHGTTTSAERFKEWALNRLGTRADMLKLKVHSHGGSDLWATKLYLLQKLDEFKKGI